MDDYSLGALSALAWVAAKLGRCRTPADVSAVRGEVAVMTVRLISEAAVSFKETVELVREL